jgi:hypothetical protein
MKRREFITSLAIIGCTAIVPLPKTPMPLTSKHYCEIIQDDLITSPALTSEALDRAFEYFGKMLVESVRICSEREKGMWDLLRK